ncbi:MAG: dihydroxyacetone kinase, subunit [Pelosinus sp.]|jgi:dihydroxyacetone kinase-like protein|nr:dihydroxyacetone kinase, subunit [Pelosinus sp.]
MGGYLYEAISAVGETIISNKQMLTDLDAAIGDGDHGINMARGFEAVKIKMQALETENDIGKILKMVGMTLISSVGGAAGPLYGTAFLRAAAPSQGKTQLDVETIGLMLEAAITGIKERGKATRGEKTMLDALEPAYEAFMEGAKADKSVLACLEAASEAAQQGVEFTKTIVATKGRASYLGERSRGHQDPGATSSYIMLQTLVEFLRR